MGGHKIVIQRRKFRGSDAYDEKSKEDNGQMRKHRGKHQFKGVYIKTRGVCVRTQANLHYFRLFRSATLPFSVANVFKCSG